MNVALLNRLIDHIYITTYNSSGETRFNTYITIGGVRVLNISQNNTVYIQGGHIN